VIITQSGEELKLVGGGEFFALTDDTSPNGRKVDKNDEVKLRYTFPLSASQHLSIV